MEKDIRAYKEKVITLGMILLSTLHYKLRYHPMYTYF
jgi:hypothetical protein